MESNDSPEIPDRGETLDIPGLPSGVTPVFAVMHLYDILEFFIASVRSFFYTFKKNLVLINQRNGPRYQRVIALYAFSTEVIAKGLILRKFCVRCLCTFCFM